MKDTGTCANCGDGRCLCGHSRRRISAECECFGYESFEPEPDWTLEPRGWAPTAREMGWWGR